MRFDSITGDAFGPYKNDELVLGPRFTVVHGLNESGKSSWAAALYASLAGRRRSRGRGSKEEAQFRARHKPWTGSRWQVTARITTDDGTRLAVVQNLAQGTTRVIDLETSHTLSPAELSTRFGIQPSTGDDIDVGQLFGLTRGTLRATTFVPQAEVMRVVDQADELQQFLQRAASSQTVDVTTHQVIDRLRDELSTRVGSTSVGQRPLRATTQQLQAASDRAYQLRAARDELRRVAVELARETTEEQVARSSLADLEMLSRWAELDAIEDRAAKVYGFDAELAELASVPRPAPLEVRERVHAARTAYLSLGEPPTPPEGVSAEDLEQQIAELPEVPAGDTSPDPQVRSLWEALQRSVSALESQAAESDPQGAPELPDLGSDELRRLADRLRLPRPSWDPAEDAEEADLRREHEAALSRHQEELQQWTEASTRYEQAVADYRQAREDYEHRLQDYQAQLEAHRRATADWESAEQERMQQRARHRTTGTKGTWQLVVGGLLVVAGLAMVLVEPLVGAVLAALGLALVGWGLLARRGNTQTADLAEPRTSRPEAPTPPEPPAAPHVAPPGPRPSDPVLPPRVAVIESSRRQWEQSVAAFDAAREELLSELRTRQLPADADELHALARALDERAGARRAAEERLAAADRLRGEIATTSAAILEALRTRGEDVDGLAGPESANSAYRRYEQACLDRAALAQAAARREDLSQALAARRAEEAAYLATVERRAAVMSTVVQVVSEQTGTDPQDAESAATAAEEWLRQQKEAEEAEARRARFSALREQLLDGTPLDALTAHADELRAFLGPRPEEGVPSDLDQALSAAGRRVEDAATRRAATEGRLRALRAEEQDLAAALEDEARLRDRLFSLEELKATLELAVEHLDVAESEAHRSLAPVLEAAMRPRIPLITAGRYRDVRVQPEDLVVELQEKTGAWRNATYLSQGTTEQTYLLLRLALVEHLDTRETMPLVLDDVTVQCDRNRTIALLELLADVSRERQVVLFSQESGVLEWAQQHLDASEGDRLVALG